MIPNLKREGNNDIIVIDHARQLCIINSYFN
jgi:hypothetical protein